MTAADFTAYLLGKLPETPLDAPMPQYPPAPEAERPSLPTGWELLDPWEPMRHWDD